jgi:hypothetical protein
LEKGLVQPGQCSCRRFNARSIEQIQVIGAACGAFPYSGATSLQPEGCAPDGNERSKEGCNENRNQNQFLIFGVV